jgi:hypothetical protein
VDAAHPPLSGNASGSGPTRTSPPPTARLPFAIVDSGFDGMVACWGSVPMRLCKYERTHHARCVRRGGLLDRESVGRFEREMLTKRQCFAPVRVWKIDACTCLSSASISTHVFKCALFRANQHSGASEQDCSLIDGRTPLSGLTASRQTGPTMYPSPSLSYLIFPPITCSPT